MTPKYFYRGDRQSRPELKGALCEWARRADGKCVRGRGNALVRFIHNGEWVVVLANQLRKLKTEHD